MNYNICLVFFGQALGFANGRALLSVFAGDTLVAFTPHGPTVFVRYHMLVLGTASFIALGAIEKDLDEFNKGS